VQFGKHCLDTLWLQRHWQLTCLYITDFTIYLPHVESHLALATFSVLQVDCPFPPSDKIGINSVQRENEEIVPMKAMKMAWVPYVPLEDRYSHTINSEQYFLPFLLRTCILTLLPH
jgi:hypothetical protein